MYSKGYLFIYEFLYSWKVHVVGSSYKQLRWYLKIAAMQLWRIMTLAVDEKCEKSRDGREPT